MLRSLILVTVTTSLTLACGRSDFEFEDQVDSPATGGTSGKTSGIGGGSIGGSRASGGTNAATGGTNAATGGTNAATGGTNAATGGTNAATGGSGAVTSTGGSSGAASATCGNAVIEANEQCDLGSANADQPALELRQGSVVVPLVPVRTNSVVHAFYDYRNGSSHTGYEATGRSRILLHLQSMTGALSLVMHHGQDTAGSAKTTFAVHFALSGLPTTSSLAISDDGAEFSKTGTTALGEWRFSGINSDGGAIGALPFPGNWAIQIKPDFAPNVRPKIEGYITHWDFANGDKSFFGLSLTEAAEIRARDFPAKCNTRCRVPRCGDGFLDGGEVCDDGNAVPNDGCTSCKALR